MIFQESLKRLVERATGLWRPSLRDIRKLKREPNLRAVSFRDDGKTPNNPTLPLIVYKNAVTFDRFDPAAVFEVLFARNKWDDSWRDGIYSFNHFHAKTHEVLGIARGSAVVRFGGEAGKDIAVEAGDVILIPAGTGHKRVRASRDLLVVGAYPRSGSYDEPRSTKKAREEALHTIPLVKLPASDPVYGPHGPALVQWRRLAREKSRGA